MMLLFHSEPPGLSLLGILVIKKESYFIVSSQFLTYFLILLDFSGFSLTEDLLQSVVQNNTQIKLE